eukprot:357944_1
MTLCLLLFFVLLVMLIGLFIYKLVKVLQNVEDMDAVRHNNMVGLISKSFILTVASILSAGCLTTAVLLQSALGVHLYVTVLAGIFANSDLLVNSLSVSLGFKKFDKYYMKLCGCCHGLCIDLCSRVVTGKSNKELMQLERVVSSASTTAKSATTTPQEVSSVDSCGSGTPATAPVEI